MISEHLCHTGLELWNKSEKINANEPLIEFLRHSQTCNQCLETIGEEFECIENYYKNHPEEHSYLMQKLDEYEKKLDTIKIL